MDKILVVEDSSEVLNNIVNILNLSNYNVFSAENGLSGLEIAQEQNPDLIISDIMMPEYDGYYLLNELRKDPKTINIPFIFLTAKVDRVDVRKGMGRGADDYVTKPFRAKELLETIKSRMEKKRRQENFLQEIYHNISCYIPHELRTPLVSIFGYTDMLIDDIELMNKTQIIEMLESIKKSGHRLHKTLEKFIQYSESEILVRDKKNFLEYTSKSTVSPSWVIKNAIIEKTKNYNHEINFLCKDDDAEISIYLNHFRIICEELIENAIKFSKNNQKIEISTKLEPNNYTIEIKNYGRGMTKEEISRISPFYQHNRSKFEQNGNGLGLVTVKKLVEFYDARMFIESEPKKFTSVKIAFPIKIAA